MMPLEATKRLDRIMEFQRTVAQQVVQKIGGKVLPKARHQIHTKGLPTLTSVDRLL